ncbi:MAG: conserved hypothetical protein [Marine Group I thaumarchaeote]|nr:MAG: conserved hypothetical protein [Marine Group I thaumarchaeote]
MALVTTNKKGGPYTKNDQEKRLNEVYRLHFEYGYSAVKIAELMKINRNTINSDISFLYSQISKNWKNYDIGSWIIKQFQRLEEQRTRLSEELEKQDQLNNKLVIERLIFDIDNKITQIITKVMPSQSFLFSKIDLDQIKDDSIKEIVRYLATKNPFFNEIEYTEDEILYEIIKMKKCDLEHAKLIVQKMEELGLKLCSSHEPLDVEFRYDMKKFAHIRGYLSKKEIVDYKEKVAKLGKEEERIFDEREKKFYGKYGEDKKKWTEKAFEEYDGLLDPTTLEEKYSDD